MNGPVTLTDVAGSVVAHSQNGRVLATLRQVTPEKPMAFTSWNGPVDITLPAAVKANLRLRSDRGDVYTDFDVQIQPQRTPRAAAEEPRFQSGKARTVFDRSILGTVNGGGPEFELRSFNGPIYLRKGK